MKIKESIRELRDICQVSFHGWGDQQFAFLQIRKVSIYLTWVLLHFPLTANGVTLLGITVGLFASLLLGLNYLIAGVIVLQISILLDFCDGEVSRYRKQQSKEGSYLDKIYHFSVHPSVFAGIAIGAHKIHPATWIVAVGFIATISVFLNSMVKGYASEIAVGAHCRKLLKRLNEDLETDPEGQGLLSGLLNSQSDKLSAVKPINGLLQGVKHSSLARMIFSHISSKWDFPYIFFVATTIIVIQLFVPTVCIGSTCFTPLELFLLFYSVTFPLSIIFFLSYILATRQIERGYDSFVQELLVLVKRTSKLNIDSLVNSDIEK